MSRQAFQKVVYSVLKQCTKLEYVYWVLASDFEQLDLVDSLTTKRLQRWCPNLKNAYVYETNLINNFFSGKFLDGTQHLKFSYMLHEEIGAFRSGQISNIIDFVSKTDLSALESFSFEFIHELSGLLPVLVANAKNLKALEILTASDVSCVLARSDFEALSKFENIERLKIRTHSRLPVHCGLDLLIDRYHKLQKFHVSQPLEDAWYYALQSNANTNHTQRLEIYSWYSCERKVSPNIMNNMIFTNYYTRGFRVEHPGNHIKFYSYNY